MKKSSVISLVTLFLLLGLVGVSIFLWKPRAQDAVPPETTEEKQDDSPQVEQQEQDGGARLEQEKPADAPPKRVTVSMEDALFIGDSRTVGLSEYSGIGGADFFANVGMSVYNIHKKPVSVPTVGKVTLDELLSQKKYGKIYLMLGINEVGYNLKQTVSKYRELLEFIEQKQPGALIFLQANLHVTKKRSDTDEVVNNRAINQLNQEISKLADRKKSFYLDENILFDDADGNLSTEKSEDTAHLYAKYYIEWGTWIVDQTGALLEGEGR